MGVANRISFMLGEGEWVSAGPLIQNLQNCVNHVEALLDKKAGGQQLDFDSLLSMSAELFPQIIEAIGSGKLKNEEYIMLADSQLHLCRLSLMFVTLDFSGTFTSGALSFLYVIMEQPVVKDKPMNEALAHRSLKILEIVDCTDPNVTGIWQCFLKILATNNSLADEDRISMLCLLISHFVEGYKNNTKLFDLSKWIQFLKIAIKLNKYVLRRKKLPSVSAENLLRICGTLLPNDTLFTEILNLPMERINLTKDLAELRDPIAGTIKILKTSDSLKKGGLGDLIYNFSSFSISNTDKTISENNSGRNSQFSPPDMKKLDTWAKIFFDCTLKAKSQELKGIFELLMTLLVSLCGQMESVLVGALIRKFILDNRYVIPKGSSPLNCFIYHAFASKPLMTSSCQEVFGQAIKAIELISKDINELLFWPFACAINIVRESPQPTFCLEILRIIRSLDNIQSPILETLISQGVRISLKYLENVDVNTVVSIGLNQNRLLSRMALLPHLPHISHTVNIKPMLTSILESLTAIIKYESVHTREMLKYCVEYLKYAQDVSIFEDAKFSTLQPFLINLLQKDRAIFENQSIFCENYKEKHLTFEIKETRIQAHSHKWESLLEKLDQEMRSSEQSDLLLQSLKLLIVKYENSRC